MLIYLMNKATLDASYLPLHVYWIYTFLGEHSFHLRQYTERFITHWHVSTYFYCVIVKMLNLWWL